MDMARFENMPSEDLEYRAKLVELIYSSQRNLLQKFGRQTAPEKKTDIPGPPPE